MATIERLGRESGLWDTVIRTDTEALTKIGSATNSKVVLMPLEASSLIGTLGGIGEIAKEVFRNEGPAGAQRQVARPPVVRPSEN